MNTTDPLADYLTRIRNAIQARLHVVKIPTSKLKKEVTKVLHDQGYILSYKFEHEDSTIHGIIKIALKYNPRTKESAISRLRRVSTPGLRQYSRAKNLPQVWNGLGIAIISTSQGVFTDKKARKMNIGGEVLCYVN